jgi:hypothetical protein
MTKKCSGPPEKGMDYGHCRPPGLHSPVAILLVENDARTEVTVAVLCNAIFMTRLRGLLLKKILFLVEIQSTSLWKTV